MKNPFGPCPMRIGFFELRQPGWVASMRIGVGIIFVGMLINPQAHSEPHRVCRAALLDEVESHKINRSLIEKISEIDDTFRREKAWNRSREDDRFKKLSAWIKTQIRTVSVQSAPLTVLDLVYAIQVIRNEFAGSSRLLKILGWNPSDRLARAEREESVNSVITVYLQVHRALTKIETYKLLSLHLNTEVAEFILDRFGSTSDSLSDPPMNREETQRIAELAPSKKTQDLVWLRYYKSANLNKSEFIKAVQSLEYFKKELIDYWLSTPSNPTLSYEDISEIARQIAPEGDSTHQRVLSAAIHKEASSLSELEFAQLFGGLNANTNQSSDRLLDYISRSKSLLSFDLFEHLISGIPEGKPKDQIVSSYIERFVKFKLDHRNSSLEQLFGAPMVSFLLKSAPLVPSNSEKNLFRGPPENYYFSLVSQLTSQIVGDFIKVEKNDSETMKALNLGDHLYFGIYGENAYRYVVIGRKDSITLLLDLNNFSIYKYNSKMPFNRYVDSKVFYHKSVLKWGTNPSLLEYAGFRVAYKGRNTEFKDVYNSLNSGDELLFQSPGAHVWHLLTKVEGQDRETLFYELSNFNWVANGRVHWSSIKLNSDDLLMRMDPGSAVYVRRRVRF